MAHQIRMLVLGHSGSGKTGALASLLNAGYNLRVLDLENCIEILVNYCTNSKSRYAKDCIERLSYITITETMRSINGRLVPAKATVWQRTMSALEHWKTSTPREADFGHISTWTDKDILVVDTIGALADGANNFNLQMNGDLGKTRTQNEWRRDIGGAQTQIKTFLQMINDSSLKCHIIVNAHIAYSKPDGQMPKPEELNPKLIGLPKLIGKAANPEAPMKFNHMLLMQTDGPVQRLYVKSPDPQIQLKSGTPLKVKDFYPIETGLADYFADARREE